MIEHLNQYDLFENPGMVKIRERRWDELSLLYAGKKARDKQKKGKKLSIQELFIIEDLARMFS